MEIKNEIIANIKPYGNNAKKHPQEQIEQIKKSIKSFGFNQPILLDENDIILTGHGRFMAAKQLDLNVIPTVKIGTLTEEQKKAYRIADNKTAESSWNLGLLKTEFSDLKQMEFDLELTGFNLTQIDDIMVEKEQITKVDKLGSLMITCPHCGGEFSRRDQKKEK